LLFVIGILNLNTMIINPNKYLNDAYKNHYAIGAFNTSSLEITQAIFEAAAKLQAPIFIQISQKAIDYAGLDNLISIIKNEDKLYKIPVFLHGDHFTNLEIIKECLKAGFTSIMFDGSKLDFLENISMTQKVVREAKKYNAAVEAELGSVGGSEDYIKNKAQMSDPEKALQFIEETGIDSLAVAFGNAHGIPNAKEKLDFKLLEKINKIVKIPLVFHGASSTKSTDIIRAISLGIAKINIDTDIRLAFSNCIKKFQTSHPDIYDPREILTSAKEAVKKIVEEKIKLFELERKKL